MPAEADAAPALPPRAAVALLCALLLLHAWLSAPLRLRPPLRQALQALPGPAAAPPRALLLPPRSVGELVARTEAGWAPCATGNTSAVHVAWQSLALTLRLQP